MLNSNYIWIIGMCLITLVIMLVIMPGLIDYLHKIKFGQTEREEGLASHKKKNGTPTMGGLAFIIVPTLVYVIGSFFTPFKLDMNTMIILLAFVGYGVVGFIDDYIIVVQKNNEGLKPGVYGISDTTNTPDMCLTTKAIDLFTDEEKYICLPKIAFTTGFAKTIDNTSEEVAEVELEFNAYKDENNEFYYEACASEVDKTSIGDKWLEEFTPSMVKAPTA